MREEMRGGWTGDMAFAVASSVVGSVLIGLIAAFVAGRAGCGWLLQVGVGIAAGVGSFVAVFWE